MAAKSYHVVPDLDEGWNVKRGGSRRASRRFATKKEAILWGRELSERRGTEFVIHRKDGTIEWRGSRGNDAPDFGIASE